MPSAAQAIAAQTRGGSARAGTPSSERHHRGDRRHDHAGRNGAGQAHAEQHADREQEVAEEGLEEHQPPGAARSSAPRRPACAASAASPAPPMPKRSQASRNTGMAATKRLGQGDVAAHQRHAQGEAGIGDQAAGRVGCGVQSTRRSEDDSMMPEAPPRPAMSSSTAPCARGGRNDINRLLARAAVHRHGRGRTGTLYHLDCVSGTRCWAARRATVVGEVYAHHAGSSRRSSMGSRQVVPGGTASISSAKCRSSWPRATAALPGLRDQSRRASRAGRRSPRRLDRLSSPRSREKSISHCEIWRWCCAAIFSQYEKIFPH